MRTIVSTSGSIVARLDPTDRRWAHAGGAGDRRAGEHGVMAESGEVTAEAAPDLAGPALRLHLDAGPSAHAGE